ncbi:endonuclease domain-containing protein [Roseibium sp.]|uniref:endonuclease domain-containing protein n=1 Tax=Roseibium sp. TaxID=1936156 RepID=UPI003A97CC6F
MASSRIRPHTRARAKELRLDQTSGEKALWRAIRELKADGVHVRRQAPVGPYIADFAMLSRKLIIEIDGEVHGDPAQKVHDHRRDVWFHGQGFIVLRYSALDVKDNLEGVVVDIRRHLGLPI